MVFFAIKIGMSNANFIELETCIEHCINYCATHKSLDFVEIYEPRLVYARTRFDEGVETSDKKYLVWQSAVADETRAWKSVASQLKMLQKEIASMGCSDYPSERIMYWDTEILSDSVAQLLTFIDSFEEKAELKEDVDKIKRGLSAAQSKRILSHEKVSEYSRFSRMRSEALGTLNATLGDFRKSMRRNLGKQSEDYNAIRWPMTLAPDERIL